ncbi:ATP-binding cassette domain-containing protein [Acetobacter sp. LMG 1636]|uniref:ATP-binding cassette domain-containing protein n=2 Tax=Acetobacter fallax TaxID=1737473 RepID=A0ABX0KHW5_9PROT|nr:ATP-binding cassette domain-containing protein [Acetobacter fallax]NHO37524.1 ATP-binding cassette domain-containing protein [Acetobacter fallax]
MIAISDVSRAFKGTTVLDHLSLDIPAGQKVALLGPSGSGKTTILRILMTLETIDSGQILIEGVPMYDTASGTPHLLPENRLRPVRSRIGMVFQHFGLFPHLSVLDNIAFPQIFNGRARKADAKARAHDLLKTVGLGDKAYLLPDQLSGGQKQRVAIARALALQPDILLFDEPTSALDPQRVSEVLDIFNMIADTTGTTMLLVTHEMEFARRFADRILFFDHGQIVEDGPPEIVFTNPKDARTRAFLGLPSLNA